MFPSSEGVQRVDNLDPLFFFLAFHHILLDVQADFVVGYLDDITIEGPITIVFEDLHSLERSALELGLSLNHEKFEVIGGSAPAPSRGIIPLHCHGF